MKKVDVSVGVLVEMIASGELRLPEMQRRYVWRAPRVRDLLDSLYRGYPSGAILVWETTETQPTRDLAKDAKRAALTYSTEIEKPVRGAWAGGDRIRYAAGVRAGWVSRGGGAETNGEVGRGHGAAQRERGEDMKMLAAAHGR